jgi:hypothetical protein
LLGTGGGATGLVEELVEGKGSVWRERSERSEWSEWSESRGRIRGYGKAGMLE